MLERISHLSLIATCLIASFILIDRNYIHPQHLATASTAVALEGRRVPMSGFHSASAEHNLILVLSSHCRFCAASVPFYQRLSAYSQEHRGVVHVFVFTQDPEPEMSEFLSRNHIVVDSILQESSLPLKIHGTPTLLITDRGGTVRKAFEGKLNGSEEDLILHGLA